MVGSYQRTIPYIPILVRWLGYADTPNWFTAETIRDVKQHRHSLQLAFAEMGVLGVYGLGSSLSTRVKRSPSYTPLVYLASAGNESAAKEIHRHVWSQGLVPFLLIATPEALYSCNALSFSSRDWTKDAQRIEAANLGVGDLEALNTISHLKARQLNSSLSWQGRSLDFSQRVDNRLLTSLEGLSRALIDGWRSTPKLPVHIANSLIGRFLYIYFLTSRKIVSTNWLGSRHSEIDFSPGSRPLTPKNFWALVDELDEIFNGSIFPISRVERRKVTAEHLELLRSVIMLGHEIDANGVQISFSDFHFASLRTETLSAVYELFFENQGNDQKENDGAFYTPPYLVDYVLTRIDEIQTLQDGTTILDCTAGSGVFLVGAFRRIVESSLGKNSHRPLTLRLLKQLLTRNIFAIERNVDACSVAAFSLYLTLLDYLSPRDLRSLAGRKGGADKIFPSLIGKNILCRDFFDQKPFPASFPKKFDCLVGNPPWQKIEKIGKLAKTYYKKHEKDLPIDRDRAAELFVWSSVPHLLKESGSFGLVLSAKSFISPGAKHFPAALMRRVDVRGITNLSHLRRKLFPGAEHPAVALFGTGAHPKRDEPLWIYSPLLSALPSGRDNSPWVITEDLAEIEKFRRAELQTADDLFRALILRPIDRKICRFLEDQCHSGAFKSLGRFCDQVGLQFKRGGSPDQTGLPAEMILSANKHEPNYYRRILGLEEEGFFRGHAAGLSQAVLKTVYPAHRAQFAGEAVIVPRSMANIDFVETPFAFNSSLNSINWPTTTRPLSSARKQVLLAIANYLRSDFFDYLCALYGRMWFLDARRLESRDLKQIPLPFSDIDDPRVQKIATARRDEVEEHIYEAFGLPDEYRAAVEEYVQYRSNFKNGQVPDEARTKAGSDDLTKYCSILSVQLNRVVGVQNKIKMKVTIPSEGGVAIVRGSLMPLTRPYSSQQGGDPGAFAGDVISEFTDSLSIQYVRDTSEIRLTKPLQFSHWTVERAFRDAGLIFETIMATAAS